MINQFTSTEQPDDLEDFLPPARGHARRDYPLQRGGARASDGPSKWEQIKLALRGPDYQHNRNRRDLQHSTQETIDAMLMAGYVARHEVAVWLAAQADTWDLIDDHRSYLTDRSTARRIQGRALERLERTLGALGEDHAEQLLEIRERGRR